MHRDGLFFDPLEAEEEAPEQAAEQAEVQSPAPPRHRQPDPEDLKVQRERELARVQDELRKMAAGAPRR